MQIQAIVQHDGAHVEHGAQQQNGQDVARRLVVFGVRGAKYEWIVNSGKRV